MFVGYEKTKVGKLAVAVTERWSGDGLLTEVEIKVKGGATN